MTIKDRLDSYEKLMRLDKPIGILLLLWPTLWALWLAVRGIPQFDFLMVFVTGTVLMRSAGCIINDVADRNFDPHVERTRDRPLAVGLVSVREALALSATLLLLAFYLVLQLNRLTILLSFFALAITVAYPFLKRLFVFPQAGLGIAFSFGVPMAYAAQHGRLPLEAWALMAATFFWIIAYDTEYAMVDRDDDVKLELKSSAILLGRYDVAGVMVTQALFLAMMLLIGYWQRFGWLYFAGLATAAALIAYQFHLIRGRDRQRCFRAFHCNNWMGLAVFTGLALELYFHTRFFRW